MGSVIYMLRIAIIDDEKDFLTIYKKIISEIFSEHHVKNEIKAFNSGKEFISALSRNKFDIVFMDIGMPELSGIDLASELRKSNQNFDIIFVSAYPHFVFEAIRFTPFRFVRKTHLRVETAEAISSYCARSQTKFKMISLELKNGDSISENVNDIIQFFAVRHDIYYINKSENGARIISRKYSLSQLEKSIGELGFIRIHKSHLVNYRYIKSINAKSILITDGRELPISHGKKTEIQERFMELLRNEDII